MDDIFVCSFKIGLPERVYSIYLVREHDTVEDVGRTDYQNARITIKNLDYAMLQKTILHELAHVWMYEMGHNQQERQFNNEDVCEILASSYTFIAGVFVDFIHHYIDLHGKHSKE